MTVKRGRRSRATVALTAATAVALTASLSACGERHDKNGDTARPDVHQTPGLSTVEPSAHPSAPVTVSPYPSATASYKRGDAQET